MQTAGSVLGGLPHVTGSVFAAALHGRISARHVNRSAKLDTRSAEFSLSDKEKEQLLKSIDDVVVDIQKKSDEITEDIQTVKEN